MKNYIWVVIVALLALVAILFYRQQASNNELLGGRDSMGDVMDEMMGDEGDEAGESMMGDEVMDEVLDEVVGVDEEMQEHMSAGQYIDYSSEALVAAQTDGKKPVLFFWAAWCPFCRAANEDFEKHSSQIPANVVILKVNYDKEQELKQRYGITYQHTFVQVDAQGNVITKWAGGGIEELVENVK